MDQFGREAKGSHFGADPCFASAEYQTCTHSPSSPRSAVGEGTRDGTVPVDVDCRRNVACEQSKGDDPRQPPCMGGPGRANAPLSMDAAAAAPERDSARRSVKIVSWNVNSLAAAVKRRGFRDLAALLDSLGSDDRLRAGVHPVRRADAAARRPG